MMNAATKSSLVSAGWLIMVWMVLLFLFLLPLLLLLLSQCQMVISYWYSDMFVLMQTVCNLICWLAKDEVMCCWWCCRDYTQRELCRPGPAGDQGNQPVPRARHKTEGDHWCLVDCAYPCHWSHLSKDRKAAMQQSHLKAKHQGPWLFFFFLSTRNLFQEKTTTKDIREMCVHVPRIQSVLVCNRLLSLFWKEFHSKRILLLGILPLF